MSRAGLVVLGVLVAAVAGAEYLRRTRVTAPSSAAADSQSWLTEPFALEPFSATDLDGRDVSTSAWAGHVVIVNFWATWCPPCRREIPMLAELQNKYRGRLLVIGVLDDGVTPEFARTFGRTVGMNYPIVPTSSEITRRFPAIPVLPMTFIIDRTTRIVAMHAGEIDAGTVEMGIRRLLGER